MSVDPQKLAVYFSLARPGGTQEMALDYAEWQFPKSPNRVGRFLAERRKLRDSQIPGR